MKKNPKNIFCLEGDWNNNLKHKSSILPALQLLELNIGIETIYKTCASFEEFEVRLNQILADKRKYNSFEIIYLAFHGRKNHIIIGEGEYSLEDIAKTFEGRLDNKMIHFGSCKTLSIDKEQANYFLEITGAKAISGYGKNVDFISSTVVDILFFEMCQKFERVHYIKENMNNLYGDLCSALDFKFYY
jgi:hypothetical protein